MNGCLNSNMNLYRSVHHPLRMFRRRLAAPSRQCSVTYQIIAQRGAGSVAAPRLGLAYHTSYILDLFLQLPCFQTWPSPFTKGVWCDRSRRPASSRPPSAAVPCSLSVLPHSITSHSMSYIKLFIYRFPVLIKRTALLFGTQTF